KPLADQRFADRVQNAAAGPEELARLSVDGEVDVAGTDSRLLVGQPLPLVGQRAQTLADQPPTSHDQRVDARPALAHLAGDLDEVAQVDGAGEVSRVAAI